MRIVAFFVFAIPLCAQAGSTDVDPQIANLAAIDQFVWEGPLFLKRNSGEDVRKLGEVTSELTEVVPNPHTEGSIRYTKLEFKDGLKISFRSFGSPVVVQFISVAVSSPKWPIKHELNVGAPLERVFKVLGTSNKTSAEEIVFSGTTEEVTFRIKNERVTEIKFKYYAD